MATDQSTTFNIETLNALGARLFDHADAIAKLALKLHTDLGLAANVCDKLASLRFEVSEIAGKAGPDTARELRDALTDAERGA